MLGPIIGMPRAVMGNFRHLLTMGHTLTSQLIGHDFPRFADSIKFSDLLGGNCSGCVSEGLYSHRSYHDKSEANPSIEKEKSHIIGEI